MKIVQELTALLQEKKQSFTQYLSITKQMLEVEENTISSLLAQREALGKAIDALQEKMHSLCNKAGDQGQQLWDAVRNKCDRDTLDAGGAALFDLAQEIFTTINHIATVEKDVFKRLEDYRHHLEQQLKAANNAPRIAQYLGAYGQSSDNNILIEDKYSKV